MIVQSNSVGRLVLTNLLGRGGMGQVWSATCPDSEKVFAVKMLAPPLVAAKDARARFEREAAILGSLDTDGIVHLRDSGETAEGVPFLVMDRVAGRSLDKILRRKKALTVRQMVSLLAPLLRALSDVHARGVSHRDIKPANVMVHRSAGALHVTLIDFGIAEAEGTPRPAGNVTGTLHYMSPEQAFGTGRPSPRDDLWSVAVMAYECLTGQMPFDAPTVGGLFEALDRGVFEPVSRFRPELPAAVDAFFQRALCPRATSRFASCASMLDALESLPQTDVRVPPGLGVERANSPISGASTTQVASPEALRVHRVTTAARRLATLRTNATAHRRPSVRPRPDASRVSSENRRGSGGGMVLASASDCTRTLTSHMTHDTVEEGALTWWSRGSSTKRTGR